MRYSVQAAAIATGVSESRLRTWERRYGVPLPARSESGRRLYEEADLAVVRRMAALVGAGIPASEAARGALTERAIEQLAPAGVAADPRVAELVEAARALDAAHIATLLAAASTVQRGGGGGWGVAVDALVTPALARMREEWADGRLALAGERLTLEAAHVALAVAFARADEPPPHARLVLLASPQDEHHELPLRALSLLLRERALRVVSLGADLPAAELASATALLAPAAVCIVGTGVTSGGALAQAARAVVGCGLPLQLFIGGAVVASGHMPDSAPGVRLAGSVVAMADAIAQVLAVPARRRRR